jgi:ribonuclease Z
MMRQTDRDTEFQMANIRRVNGALLALLVVLPLFSCTAADDGASDCLEVTLTGTQGGPVAVGGLAGAGTLVRYGSVANQCSDVLLQFDAGRGTTERLSQLGVSPNDLNAVFLTHLHSDHIEGLIGLMQLRWHINGGELDVVCSGDVETATPPPTRVLSCRGFTEHIGDAFIHAGEIAQRFAENGRRHPEGPAAIIRLQEVAQPLPVEPGTIVWEADGVRVSAVATTHIAGSLAYRVDTPAGSVVIGGDAGNRKTVLPRESSTSDTVEALAQGADILVHSVIHPVFAPGGDSTFPAPVYLRQSSASDLGAMAQRAGISHLVMTHMIPSLNSRSHGPFMVPGGPIVAEDFRSEARQGGFEGQIHVGVDLLTVRIP